MIFPLTGMKLLFIALLPGDVMYRFHYRAAAKCYLFALSSLLVLGLSACSAFGPSRASMERMCQAADLSNDSQRSLLLGGYYALRDDKLECAERLTTAAERADPFDAYAKLNMGVVYQRTGRQGQARAAYVDAIRLDSDSSDTKVSELSTDNGSLGLKPGQIARRNLASLDGAGRR
jgi:tetratricopeptide (TPR) repeat protein